MSVLAMKRSFVPHPSTRSPTHEPIAGLWTLVVSVFLGATLALAGCGGGPSPGAAAIQAAPGAPTDAGGRGAVHVTLAHAYGAPAAGVEVFLTSSTTSTSFNYDGKTDAAGEVTFNNVQAGWVTVSAGINSPLVLNAYESTDLWAGAGEYLSLVLRPNPSYSTGVIRTMVPPDGLDADGRGVEFVLDLLYESEIGHIDGSFDVWLDDCPGPTGDADCVDGPTGFDAEYLGGAPVGVDDVPGGPALPYSAGLLIDQSHRAAQNDPSDARLYATKYLLGTLSEGGSVTVGAFAADDPDKGELSALPGGPVVLLSPAGAPFSKPNETLYAAVDSLADQEGGTTPLYAALNEMLDFVDAHAPQDRRRAVIVVAAGMDDACGTPESCLAARQAVIDKSISRSIAILAIALRGPAADERLLGDLVTATGGVTLWAEDPVEIAWLLPRLTGFLEGSTERHSLRFRAQSQRLGTFQSGYIVLGGLSSEICAWGCWGPTTVPIRIPIP